ncbi:hypothetical protein MRY87_10615 [bacterium]|nr:hypothetical protein [bacterium]
MKKFLLILIATLFVGALGIGIFAYTQADKLIAKLKPEIEKRGSEALATDLSIGDIRLGFHPSPYLQVERIQLVEPKNPDRKLLVNGGGIEVGLLDLLLGKLSIHSVELNGLQVRAQQTSGGVSIEGLPQKPKQKVQQKTPSGEEKRPAKKGAGTPAAPPSWLQVDLDSLAVSETELHFQTLQGDLFRVEDGALRTTLSLQGPRAILAALTLSAEVTAEKKEQQYLQSALQVDLSQGSVHLGSLRGSLKQVQLGATLPSHDITLTSSLSNVDFDGKEISTKIKQLSGEATHPAATSPITFSLKDVQYDGTGAVLPEGEIALALQEIGEVRTLLRDITFALPQQRAAIGSLRTELLGGAFSVKGGYTVPSQSGGFDFSLEKIQYLGEPISGKGSLKATNGTFTLRDTQFNAFDTSITPSLTAKPFTAALPFSVEATTQNLPIERALALAMKGEKAPITGTLQQLQFAARGNAKERPAETLTADAKLAVVNGTFTGGNLPALVLRAMKDIPFLNEAVFGSVPEEYQGELNGDTTPIRSLQTEIAIADQVITAQSLSLESSLFSMKSEGTIRFDSTLNLKTTFRFIPALSLSLASKVTELNKLLDEKQQLVIPLQITGKANAPIILPNMKEIMKLGAGKVIEEKATELLNKALGSSTKKGESSKGDLVKGLLGF